MSQEWNPQGEPKPEQNLPPSYRTPPAGAPAPAAPASPKMPPRNNTWIYGLIIAALLGTNIYLFMNKNKITEEKKVAVSQRDSAVTTRDAIKTDYDAAIVRLDQMVSKNTALNEQINSKDGEIVKLRHQIDGILHDKNASAADLAKARKLITQLNVKVQTYEERISKLEGENKTLTNQNAVITKERDVVATENQGLQEKVHLAAVLHASNIRMTAINLRHHGTKAKETEKARKVDLLRIFFDIDDNRVAESGNKELYLRITGPDGNLMSNAAYGSGTTTTSDKQPLNYTLVKQIALTQNQPVKDVTIDWNQDSDYNKGTYSIEIYNEGFKIGSGSVTLH